MPYRLIITLGFMVGLFILSSVPGHTRPDDSTFVWFVVKTPSLIQKIMHVLLYGGLSWLWFWALADLHVRVHYRALAALVITAAYGAFNEWHQLHAPGRYGSLTDVVLNSIGAVLGILVALIWTG